MANFITASDLKNALGLPTYTAIFDDDGDGVVKDTDAQVVLVIQRAHAQVISYLPRIYNSTPAELPSPVPILLKSAELDYASAYAFERHPEYVRSFGEKRRLERWERAQATMERIANSIQQIAPNDNPPEAKPGTSGGLIFEGTSRRTIMDSFDGTYNGGDF